MEIAHPQGPAKAPAPQPPSHRGLSATGMSHAAHISCAGGTFARKGEDLGDQLASQAPVVLTAAHAAQRRDLLQQAADALSRAAEQSAR